MKFTATMTLEWTPSAPCSALHAAAAMLGGHYLVEQPLAERLAPHAETLAGFVHPAGHPGNRLIEHLVPLAAYGISNEQLAERALTKTIGAGGYRPTLIQDLAACLAHIEQTFNRILPKAEEEVALRSQTLRQAWADHGDGLLKTIARLAEPELIAQRADVVLVYPVLGGAGVAHLAYNSVRIEALPTDPHPELPEAMRLAWLLAQLQLELPAFSEQIPGGHLGRTAALALIPPVLAAAEELQLARLDVPGIQRALQAWLYGSGRAELAETLIQWWELYLAANPRWAVALAALDEMVEARSAPAEAHADAPWC